MLKCSVLFFPLKRHTATSNPKREQYDKAVCYNSNKKESSFVLSSTSVNGRFSMKEPDNTQHKVTTTGKTTLIDDSSTGRFNEEARLTPALVWPTSHGIHNYTEFNPNIGTTLTKGQNDKLSTLAVIA